MSGGVKLGEGMGMGIGMGMGMGMDMGMGMGRGKGYHHWSVECRWYGLCLGGMGWEGRRVGEGVV